MKLTSQIRGLSDRKVIQVAPTYKNSSKQRLFSGCRRAVRDLKQEKDLAHCCWLEIEVATWQGMGVAYRT